MIEYLAGILAARIAVVFCILSIALPYALRRNRLSRGLGFAQEHATPYLRRLWPHYWVGYAILALTTLHAGSIMGAMGRANANGILAATLAFFLLVFEIALGLMLKQDGLPSRRPLRLLHFWIMTAFAVSLGLHLWWNA